MKHAGPDTLARLAPLLQALRALPGLQERRPGCFYRRGRATLHFHDDPGGVFADLRAAGTGFTRLRVDTPDGAAQLVAQVRDMLMPRD